MRYMKQYWFILRPIPVSYFNVEEIDKFHKLIVSKLRAIDWGCGIISDKYNSLLIRVFTNIEDVKLLHLQEVCSIYS